MPGNVPIKLKDSSCPKQFTCTIAYIASATASLFFACPNTMGTHRCYCRKNLGSHLLALKSLSPHHFGFHGEVPAASLPASFPPPGPASSTPGAGGLGKNEVGFMLGQGCSTPVIYCSNHPVELCFPQIAHINYQPLLPLAKVNATSCFTGGEKFRG